MCDSTWSHALAEQPYEAGSILLMLDYYKETTGNKNSSHSVNAQVKRLGQARDITSGEQIQNLNRNLSGRCWFSIPLVLREPLGSSQPPVGKMG